MLKVKYGDRGSLGGGGVDSENPPVERGSEGNDNFLKLHILSCISCV